jgi:hypothetical protein
MAYSGSSPAMARAIIPGAPSLNIRMEIPCPSGKSFWPA